MIASARWYGFLHSVQWVLETTPCTKHWLDCKGIERGAGQGLYLSKVVLAGLLVSMCYSDGWKTSVISHFIWNNLSLAWSQSLHLVFTCLFFTFFFPDTLRYTHTHTHPFLFLTLSSLSLFQDLSICHFLSEQTWKSSQEWNSKIHLLSWQKKCLEFMCSFFIMCFSQTFLKSPHPYKLRTHTQSVAGFVWLVVSRLKWRIFQEVFPKTCIQIMSAPAVPFHLSPLPEITLCMNSLLWLSFHNKL